MRKILKVIGSLVVVLVVLVVALAIAVPLLFDINDQKDRIAEMVERDTGRALTIDGDLELTIFPWLGVETGAMSLAQAPGFDDDAPFASFTSANVSVKLMPLLLRREVELGRVTLRGLTVALVRNADGTDNWSDLIDGTDTAAVEDAGPGTDDGFDLEKLQIAGVVLSDARFSFRDEVAGTSYVVDGVDLQTGPLRLGEAVELSMDARIASAVPQWRADIHFTGVVEYDAGAGTIDARTERLTTALAGGLFPFDAMQVTLDGRIHGDLERMRWRADGLTADITATGMHGGEPWRGEAGFAGGVEYDGGDGAVAVTNDSFTASVAGDGLPVTGARLTMGGRVNGNLERETWRVEGLDLQLVARGGPLPDGDHPIRLTASSVVADLAAQTASLADARFEGLGVRAVATADGTRIVDEPRFNGRITVDAFSPRALLSLFGHEMPEMRDPSTLTHLQLGAAFTAGRQSASLTELDAQLDATRITGQLGIADMERKAFRFQLVVDQLDLDRYLPPETPETEDAPAGALDAVEIPVELLRRLDVDGGLRIGRLQAFGLNSEAVATTVRAQDGLLRVNPATARLYGGSYSGDITVDARREVPRVSIDERLSGVQAGTLFGELFDQSRITGTADFHARLNGAGHTVGAIRQSLDGRVEFSFRDGAVQGFDLWHMIRDARAVLRGEERPGRPEGNPQTAFGRLSGSGVVANGVMTSNDLAAQLPFMTVAGGGSFDLAAAAMDYRLRATVQRVPGVDGEAGDGELEGLTIPFVIRGPVEGLSYRVDLAGILRDRVQQELDSARERLERELLERLRERIR